MKILKLFLHLLFVVFLTLLTQVGGIIWLFAYYISYKFSKKKRYVFPVLYLLFNLVMIPPIASKFGRFRLPVFSKHVKPRNLIYPLFFRNYVKTDLKNLIESTAEDLKYSNITITYLDANFPFLDGFPLLPHLSHNDGKKVDISFNYLDNNGKSTDKKPSISGYGVYVKSENSTSNNCIKKGYWQYDFPKYLTFGTINDLEFDTKGTKILIEELLSISNTQKILIEPYLKQELGLSNYSIIRFHGCQAVRHDDHIHLQTK